MIEKTETSIPFPMVGLVLLMLSVVMMSASRSYGGYSGSHDYHNDYTKPLRWFGVPNSNLNEIRRVDAKDQTCGTLYHSPFTEINNQGKEVDSGWTVYGLGYSEDGLDEQRAINLINQNCY